MLPTPALRRLAALSAAAALLAGCGGETEEDEVRAVVTAFGDATRERDYDRICDEILSPELLESVREIGLPCRLALEQGLGEVEDPRLVVGAVRVDGEEAEVDVRTSAKGQAPSRDTVSLVKVEDRWRIAELSSGDRPAGPRATP